MEVIVLALVATLFFASYALWKRGRGSSEEKALPAPVLALSDGERTIHNLQVGDIASYAGDDFIVEGVLTLHEDGRTTRLYRLVDGATVRWLAAHAGDDAALWLEEAPELAALPVGPDTLDAGEMPYRLASRATVVATRLGNVGARALADKVRVHEYAGAGSARLVALGPSEASTRSEPSFVLRGEQLLAGSVELLPGK